MASIALQGITKDFGDTRVLDGIDLDIADGEFLTLVGPSGCGKSTTLRIIAGLEAQTAGNVEIDGVVVNDVRPGRARFDAALRSGGIAEVRQLAQRGDHGHVGVDVRPVAAHRTVLQPHRPHSDIA